MVEMAPPPHAAGETAVLPARGRRGMRLLAREVAETLALSLILFVLARATISPFRIDGHSMDPTLHNGEFILVDKMSYRLGSPQRGDIVVFKPPFPTPDDYVKRVIGLPGDVVRIAAGRVYVNGRVLPEPYLPAANRPAYEMAAYRVPPHDLFVLGDNRNNSYDSHFWGRATPLDRSLVIGLARVAYWPLPDLAFFSPPSYAAR